MKYVPLFSLCEIADFVYVHMRMTNVQGPVVQSVYSLTSSLRVISLTVLADSIHNILFCFFWGVGVCCLFVFFVFFLL